MKVSQENGIIFNFAKCDIPQPNITYGCLFREDGIKPDLAKISVTCHTSADVQKFQSWLWLTSEKCSIPHMFHHKAPFRELIEKNRIHMGCSSQPSLSAVEGHHGLKLPEATLKL